MIIYIFGIVILIIIILKKFYYKSYNKKETKKTLINKEVEKNQFAENLQKEERKKNMSPKEGEEIVGTFFDEYEQKSIEREKRIDNIFNSEIASSNDLTDKEKKDNFAYKIFEDRIRSSSKNKNKRKEENELEEYYSKAIAQLTSKEYETLVKSIQNNLETLFEKNGGFMPFRNYVAELNSSQGLIKTTAILPFLVEAWNAAVSKIEGEDLDPKLSFKVDNELVERILSSLYEGDVRAIRESIKNASKSFSQAKNRPRTSPQRPIQESRDIEDESTGDKTGVVILPGEDQATYEYDGEDLFTSEVYNKTYSEKGKTKENINTKESFPNLDEFNIDYLYHITHKDNLNNILQNGLESHNVARERHMIKVDIADNVVNDRRKRKELIYNRSLHDYVPLYFNPKNPMLYKRKNLQDDIVILAIDKNILKQKNVLFTDGNAASKSTKTYKNLNDLYELKWECINNEYWTDYVDGKRIKCAEVLVFPKIHTSAIKKIFSNNEQTRLFVEDVIAFSNNINIKSEVNDKLYFSQSKFTMTDKVKIDW